jgi:hypothetical protein
MVSPRQTILGDSPRLPPAGWRTGLRDAVKFWEPRRILYNAVLAAVVLAWVGFTWPHFLPAFKLDSLLLLSVLALIANACYSTAYLVEVPARCSSLAVAWCRWRWVVWSAGMLLAILVANYWIADEIYPFVR